MAEDARLSIIIEANIQKLDEQLSRGNSRIADFSASGQRQFEALRAKIDPVGVAAEKMGQSVQRAHAYLAAGKITVDQHTAALALATAEFQRIKKAADDAGHGLKGAGDGAGFNRSQLLELSHVARASFDALAAGANPLRILALESGRVTQALGSGSGGMAGGFAALARLAASPIPILGALAAAVVGLFVVEQQYEAQQRKTQVTLRGFGAASGATLADINAITDAQVKAGAASRDLAEEAEAAFLKAGASKDNLAPGISVLKDFAALSGETVPDALKTLAGAYSDPAKFAEEFGGSLLNLTAVQIEHIHQLQEQGDKTKATAELLRDLSAASRGAGEELKNGLGQALDGLKNKFGEIIGSLGELLYKLTHDLPAAAKVADLQRQRAEIVAQGAAAGKVDNAPFLASIDRQIAAAQSQAAKDAAKAAPAVNAAAAAKQGRETQALVDEANPDARRRRDLIDRRAGLVGRLNNAGAGGPSSQEIQAAIAATDKSIKAIDTKGQKKPRRGPEDQTTTLDAATTQALDRANQEYLRSLLALTSDIQQRADIEKQSVGASLQKELDALDAEEVKVRRSKNDAHKAEQIATLEAAKKKAQEAAENQKALIDQQAIRDAIEQELKSRQRIRGLLQQMGALDADLALTQAERRAIERTNLAYSRKVEDDNLRRQRESEDVGKNSTQLSALQSRRQAEDATTGDIRTREDEKLRRNTSGPLEKLRDESLRTAAQVQEAYQNVAAKGLESLTNGITDAITGTKSLGDAFKEVANGIIADLVRIAVQRAITQPIADLLFPGGGTAGLLSGVLGHHATGANSFGGGFTHLNENGPEGVAYLPKGTQIIPNDILRSLANGVPRMGGGTTVVQPMSFDLRGAVMTDDILAQINARAAQAHSAAVRDARALVPRDLARTSRFRLPG